MPFAPQFWRANGVAAHLLSPLGWLFGALAKRRLRRSAPRAALPTIIVGGLTTGGDGKTPLVVALATLLTAQGERPALLTRGYGRRANRATPFSVGASDDVDSTGDEALLLARHALTIVGVDRAASAELARRLGATVLILDDGFHSRRIAGDFSLLVVDSDYGAGNGRCLPAGPLRAPLAAQFEAADALVVIGEDGPGQALADQAAKPVFRGKVVGNPQASEKIAGARIVAFAGIGRPEKFFRTLTETGAQIVGTYRFPDHRRFAARDIGRLAALQRRHRAQLVTTEKDAVRIPAEALAFEVLPIDLAIADANALAATLAARLQCARLSRAS